MPGRYTAKSNQSCVERTQVRKWRKAEEIRSIPVMVRSNDCQSSLACIVFRDRPDKRFGGLAQLGERLPCKQEVSGSIPLISTKWIDSAVG